VFDAFRGFQAILIKESIHIRRDRMAIFFALLIPLIQMTVLGAAIDTNIRQVHTIVLNEDGRQPSRDLIDRFRNSDIFQIIGTVRTDEELNEAIVSGRARVGIKIPVDYSDRLLDHDAAQVLVLIDGSDSSVAGTALNVSTAIGLDESLRRVLSARQKFAVEMRPRLLFNPASRSPNFFLPGLMAVLLIFVSTMLTAFAIVREKEKGTIEQLFVTPVKPLGLLLGKLVPYLVIGYLEMTMLLMFMRFVFQVPIHGAMTWLFVLALPYLFVNLSIGLLISGKAQSQPEAMQLAMMVFLPTIFFSGYIFPRETMPLPFYLFSFLVPGAYFINITRGVILRGAGLHHLWLDGLVLLGMGAALLLLAAKRFQKKVIAT
jgi:ABC-2 type transport system permease protein